MPHSMSSTISSWGKAASSLFPSSSGYFYTRMRYAKSNDEFIGTVEPNANVEDAGALPTLPESDSGEGEAVKTRPRSTSLASVSTGSSIEEQKILLVNKALDDTGFGLYQKSIFLLCGFGYFLGASFNSSPTRSTR